MRRHRRSLMGRLLLVVVAGGACLVGATPYPKDDDLDHSGYLSSDLAARDCASYCGADGQFCCNANERCTTLAGNVATCVAGSLAGYTTTWTETRTYTSTIMTHWIPAPAPTPGVDCKPQSPEQEACGAICCAGWQSCAYQGQCSPRPGYQEPSTVVLTSNGLVTTRYSAPYRVTGTTTIVNSGVPGQAPVTSPANPSSTSDRDTAGGDGGTVVGTGGGLSAGAIAGIVIGTLAGVALLVLLCFCCIARNLWSIIFGRKRHSEKIIVEEERHSHHAGPVPSAYSRRDRHSGWFGSRPASASGRRANKSDGKWYLGLAGIGAALLALLNMRKDKKPDRRRPASSRYSYSDYTYSDATSYTGGTSSSGGRTHRTGRTAGHTYRSPSRVGSYHSRAPSRRP